MIAMGYSGSDSTVLGDFVEGLVCSRDWEYLWFPRADGGVEDTQKLRYVDAGFCIFTNYHE